MLRFKLISEVGKHLVDEAQRISAEKRVELLRQVGMHNYKDYSLDAWDTYKWNGRVAEIPNVIAYSSELTIEDRINLLVIFADYCTLRIRGHLDPKTDYKGLESQLKNHQDELHRLTAMVVEEALMYYLEDVIDLIERQHISIPLVQASNLEKVILITTQALIDELTLTEMDELVQDRYLSNKNISKIIEFAIDVIGKTCKDKTGALNESINQVVRQIQEEGVNRVYKEPSHLYLEPLTHAIRGCQAFQNYLPEVQRSRLVDSPFEMKRLANCFLRASHLRQGNSMQNFYQDLNSLGFTVLEFEGELFISITPESHLELRSIFAGISSRKDYLNAVAMQLYDKMAEFFGMDQTSDPAIQEVLTLIAYDLTDEFVEKLDNLTITLIKKAFARRELVNYLPTEFITKKGTIQNADTLNREIYFHIQSSLSVGLNTLEALSAASLNSMPNPILNAIGSHLRTMNIPKLPIQLERGRKVLSEYCNYKSTAEVIAMQQVWADLGVDWIPLDSVELPIVANHVIRSLKQYAYTLSDQITAQQITDNRNFADPDYFEKKAILTKYQVVNDIITTVESIPQ